MIRTSTTTRSKDGANGSATVKISGGHGTDARDNGRPVILVAAGLGVPTEVFRKAFSGVTPAAGGEEPDPGQVRENKAALLKVLAPYGVTNDLLDTVSNYYRYSSSQGEHWRQTPAKAKATVEGGEVVSVEIVAAGAGYSTPTVTIPKFPGTRVKAKLAFSKKLSRNGRVSSLRISR